MPNLPEYTDSYGFTVPDHSDFDPERQPRRRFSIRLECGDSGKRLAIALAGADEFGFRLVCLKPLGRVSRTSMATGKVCRITYYAAFFLAEHPIDYETFKRFSDRIECSRTDKPLDFWD